MGSVLHLVGFDDRVGQDFSVLRHALHSSVILIASTRLYHNLTLMFPGELLPPQIPIVPLDMTLQRIEESLRDGDVTVLASGDPLFLELAANLSVHFLKSRFKSLLLVLPCNLLFPGFRYHGMMLTLSVFMGAQLGILLPAS